MSFFPKYVLCHDLYLGPLYGNKFLSDFSLIKNRTFVQKIQCPFYGLTQTGKDVTITYVGHPLAKL